MRIVFRLLIVTASEFTFALCGSNLVHCFNKYRPLFAGRIVHDNSGGGFLLSIPVVQTASAAESMANLIFEGLIPELSAVNGSTPRP